MTQTMPLDLAGFIWSELMILANHLQYAADRLEQEMDNLRQKPTFTPKKPDMPKNSSLAS
jgi:hypothetical protein